MMNTVNNETIKAMGKRAASIALDQGDEFGTIQDTIQAYRENLSDTLSEEGLLSWEWMAIDAYDRHVTENQA
jgi:hypothetical protein